MSDSRAEFEAWVETLGGHPFAGQFLNLMWNAWQASRAQPERKQPVSDLAAFQYWAAGQDAPINPIDAWQAAIAQSREYERGFNAACKLNADISQPERKLTDAEILKLVADFGIECDGNFHRTDDEDRANMVDFARALLAAQPAAATPEEIYQLREQNNHLVALFDAAKNLIKVNGRHNTEIAYQRLVAAFDAASGDKPAAATVPEWISVDERLPEDDVEVLINGSEGVEIARYMLAEDDCPDSMGHDAGWCGYKFAMPGRSFGAESYMCQAQGQPTHWMPLPQPPAAQPQDDGDKRCQ